MRWKEFQHFFASGFPYIVLIIGFVFLVLGNLHWIKSTRINDLVIKLGELGLGAGIFTFMMKSFQYTNVFKEELIKVISTTQYLANRKDLSDYWAKVSRVLFEDKFPDISHRLLEDIRKFYLPTNSIMYYEGTEHTIEILLDNELTGECRLKRKFKLKAIPEHSNCEHFYTFGISIPAAYIGAATFATKVYVNGQIKLETALRQKEDFVAKDGNFGKEFSVELFGEQEYDIKREEEVSYNIYNDNILFFQSNKILKGLTVNLHYPKDKLTIEFKKCGTLAKYNSDENITANSARFVYDGLIYPEQGYYINIRKK
ncbi:hypothetical protein GCM10023093_13670 [Nemorincola caseinilytica]|uniref:SMODS-associated and fused to various effectors domain-containing protein n=2 Tax=Nemorincola caseinilytica TaxID=2054315 RepID=A0ABP8NDD6_9BACT